MIDFKKLTNASPEEKQRRMDRVKLSGVEYCMLSVPSSPNPNYDLGCALENLATIHGIEIDDDKVAELKYRAYGSPVAAEDMLYVTNKFKEAKALLYG